MKRLPPNWTSGLVPFTAASQDCLDRNGAVPGALVLANVSKDGAVGWVARGGVLEVFVSSSGQRLAAWTFGAVLKDSSTLITALTEYSYDGALRLLVATTSSSTLTGMLCVFDIKASKVIKAIEVPYKITAIEPVTSVGADQAPAQVLSEHLRCFCGVIAAGTQNGHVYMIDLNLDDESDGSDEIRPNSVLFLDPRVRDVASRRFSAISKRRHLCLELDGEAHQRGYYYFRKPDSSIVKTYVSDDLCVSSLLYMRQTASLVVGFSFGCFQLWGLYTPVLEYTSRMIDSLSPITHFSYQEPENDPRNFVYIWVARGPMPVEAIDEQIASVSLFQLGYDKKVWHEGLGHVYEDLQSVGPRFEHFLTTNPYSTDEDCSAECSGSRVICCYTIQDTSYAVPERLDQEDSFDDGSGGPDLSRCVFVWEAVPADPALQSHYHLAVFDMNRWYHCQMPHVLRYSSLTNDTCPFLAFYSLDTVSQACATSDIMAVHVNAASLARYRSCVVPAPEHHLYPSSLAFEAVAVSESGLVLLRFLGQQRQVVADLLRGGPALLVEPSGGYGLCLCAGLLPRTADVLPTATVPATEKRLAVLNVLLDHNQVNFLTACVVAWGSGEFSGAGCTLRCLLDWAWSRVGVMKESMDMLCVSLYNWSGLPLDSAALTLLHHHQVALQHLGIVMTTMLSVGVASTEQGRADLETKVMVVGLIDSHLAVLIWSIVEGFLPEVGEDTAPSDTRYAFPYGQLKAYFTQRRAEISHLNSDLRGTELLMIDGVLEQAGSSLQELWENEGGSATYPPPSLHAVLNMFLLENVPLVLKHSIFFYLLCDLMYLTPEETTERFERKMHHFTQAFSLPYATIRLVQGFWHLDRKEFEEAMLFLLDPIIRSELLPWQHTRIVKALLYQGRHKMALKYIRIKKPPMITPVDVKLRLTVLLANGLTAEAFEYQRSCRDQGNMEDLLSHLFLGCQQTRTMDQLLQLPLSSDEERCLMSHMKGTTEPHAAEVLVLHYLQRARVIEALSLNARIKHSCLGDIDTVARERSLARQSIVDCYHRILPRAQRKLAFGVDQAMKRGTSSRREVTRPVPLSMFVNQSKRNAAVSHATLISTVLEKVREVKDYDEEPQSSASGDLDMSAGDHPGPFMCTPITPRTRSRISSETAEVVYPSVQPPALSSPHCVFAPSPKQRGYDSGSPTITLLDSLKPVNFSTSRRQSRIVNAAALSLLQTPPVRRRSSTSHTSVPHSASTPQSILKVRHTAWYPDSPLTAKSTTFLEQAAAGALYRKLNMDQDAEPLSALPGSMFRPVHAATAGSAVGGTAAATTTSTPKQLRFSVPASPDSTPDDRSTATTPSPQPPPNNVAVSMRSVRDRSPTPERNSPRDSPKMDVLRGREPRITINDMDIAMETDDEMRMMFTRDPPQQDVIMEDATSSRVTKHYAEQEEEGDDMENELSDSVVVTDSNSTDVSKASSGGVSVHYEEMSGSSDEDGEEDDLAVRVGNTPPVTDGTATSLGQYHGIEMPRKVLKKYYAEQEEPVVNRFYAEQEEPVANRYHAEQEGPVANRYHVEQEGPVVNRYHAEQQEAVVNRFHAEQQEPVVNRYHAEQQEPVVNRYYAEQEGPMPVNRYYAEQDSDVEERVAVKRANDQRQAVGTSAAGSQESDLDGMQPMDTQPVANSVLIDLCGSSKKSSTDSDTLESSITDGSDSQSVSTSCSGTDVPGRTVMNAASQISISSSSGVDAYESDGEQIMLHLDDAASDMDDVVNGDAESERTAHRDDETAWTGSEGDVSSVVTSRNAQNLLKRPGELKTSPSKANTEKRSKMTRRATASMRRTRGNSHTDDSTSAGEEVDDRRPVTPTRSTRAAARATTPPRVVMPARTTRVVTPLRTAPVTTSPSSPPMTLATTPPRTTRATTRASTPPRTIGAITPPQTRRAIAKTRTIGDTTPPPQTRQATTPPQTTRAATLPRTIGDTSPPQTRRATTPPRVTKSTASPTGITTPPQTRRATTPPRTVGDTSPLRNTRAATPPRTTRATTPPRTTRATTPPRTTRATTPPRTTRATTPPRTTRATTPPRTTRATTPPRTIRDITPPQTRRATTPPRTSQTTTPTQTMSPPTMRSLRSTTPQRSLRLTTPPPTPQASTPPPSPPASPSKIPVRSTRATTPQCSTHVSAMPEHSTRGTTPPRLTRAMTPQCTTRASTPSRDDTSPPEPKPDSRSRMAPSPARLATPTCVTRSHQDSDTSLEEDMDMQTEQFPKAQRHRSKGTLPAETDEPLSVLIPPRSSRIRVDSMSDTKLDDDENSDSAAIVTSTESRRSIGRLGLRSSSPVMGDGIDNVTPPRTGEQQEEIAGRVTRSGSRPKTSLRQTPPRRCKKEGDVEGLLSSQSFMMRTRQGSDSREGTPEPPCGGAVVSDVSSTFTEDDIAERTNFTFAEPMAVDTSSDVPDVATVIPASSFYFSPPLTRTRIRSRITAKSTKSDRDLKNKVKVINLLPDAPSDLVTVITKKVARTGKKVKTSALATSSESAINFLSPESGRDEPSVELRRPALQKKPMTLRPKRVVVKKSSLKLW